jgi:uncharacterized membrane protein YfcA
MRDSLVAPWPEFVLAGGVIGTLLGLFGVGGSSIATPILSLLGVPGLVAIASPLPATVPGAVAAAVSYTRSGEARPRAAAWTVAGGVPAAILGALLSRAIGGPSLLVASGVVLAVVGWRVLQPIDESARERGTRRRRNRFLLVAASFGVGLFTGLLANGGGFLLVPLYLLVFGLRMRQAVGTSLLVIVFLAVPTLVTHWALGHIDWSIAAALALGMIPASIVASRYAHSVEGPALRRSFGLFLIGFGVMFTLYRVVSGSSP